jgi:tryptophan 6-halogenase
MTNRPPSRVVILGGGTAGWMAANLIAKKWHGPDCTVTVVESPEVSIIGVGEGSTPQLKAFFDLLGIAESHWMPLCNATYKNGIRFNGWSDRPGFESYFHPFITAIDHQTAPAFFYNAWARRIGRDVWAHPDRFFLLSHLAVNRLAPIASENFPFTVTYGYHFDAYLVGEYLRDHAKSLGVQHLQRHVLSVKFSADGNISHLVARDGDTVEGDFFIDCSGFKSTILQEAIGEPFLSFADVLYNDSAIVLPTPADTAATNAQTSATAMKAGWIWDIPLTNRTGNGYVYASDFISADNAEIELRRHIGMLDSTIGSRHLKMKVGRVKRSWVSNCLAVGLAQGFIEPLEATALHIVQSTVEMFLETYESNRDSEKFNNDIAARYDGIRDYIVCHYKLSKRRDTSYWRENSANMNISDSLKNIMTTWFTGKDLAQEISSQGIEKYYTALSWHCLLAGYGTFPDDKKLLPPDNNIEKYDVAQIDNFIRRCGLNFSDHKAVLDGMIPGSPKSMKVA